MPHIHTLTPNGNMNKQAFEINLDGLVGPTHNYSGLSFGNIASTSNQLSISKPKEAALQGLEKMKFLSDLGLIQVVLPPHERPFIPFLRRLGYGGTDEDILSEASTELLNVSSSAAAMWVANAATISPSSDSDDGKVHITPANLADKLHRSIESDMTSRILKRIFADSSLFEHHSPLPSGVYFSDEGAANHTRFCGVYGRPGVQLFVWGRRGMEQMDFSSSKFPARQTLEASQAIARLHRLDTNRVVFARQTPQSIDAGVFHNDVISVGNRHVFFCHEDAFVNQKGVINELKEKFYRACGLELMCLLVPKEAIPLDVAVSSYLFNSQLISSDDETMAIIAPSECRENVKVGSFLEKLVSDSTHPIKKIHYLNLRESMRNGGGPACLRLRVVLTERELSSMHQGVLFTPVLYEKLKEWIQRHYREELRPQDLRDPQLMNETRTALDKLTTILRLGSIYDFQR